MPIDISVAGQSTADIQHEVDARWIMAYAAGLGDFNPRYMDTGAGALVAHPLFPVCLEWPVVLASRNLPGYAAVSPEEGARAVHAAHDLHLLRPIRPGDVLATRATVVGVRRIRPGAAVTTRLDTRDATGALVCRTWQLSISRDVAVTAGADGNRAADGGPPPDPSPERFVEALPEPPAAAMPRASATTCSIAVAQGAAHVYTECARIFNPIHTDRAVALAAGLPDIILHGTATLALAVGRLVDDVLGGDPTRVRRLGGRFSAMVRMPSTLTLAAAPAEAGCVGFEVLTEDGAAAVSRGFLVYE